MRVEEIDRTRNFKKFRCGEIVVVQKKITRTDVDTRNACIQGNIQEWLELDDHKGPLELVDYKTRKTIKVHFNKSGRIGGINPWLRERKDAISSKNYFYFTKKEGKKLEIVVEYNSIDDEMSFVKEFVDRVQERVKVVEKKEIPRIESIPNPRKWNLKALIGDNFRESVKKLEPSTMEIPFVPLICSNCNGTEMKTTRTGVACGKCGEVNNSELFDYRDPRAFTPEQVKTKLSHSTTSNLMYDKNLGSIIKRSRKYYGNHNVFRLLNAERKLSMSLEQRELKEVIRILSLLSDSSNVNLSHNEIEKLIVTYKKKFLGKGISIGRKRNMVLAAYIFLEIREMKRHIHLTYEQYFKMIGIPIIKIKEKLYKQVNCIQNKMLHYKKRTQTKFTKRRIRYLKNETEKLKNEYLAPERDFKSALKYLVNVHNYHLTQPSLIPSIENVMFGLGIEPYLVTKAKIIAKKVEPFYKYNARKNAGKIAAIIYLVLKKTKKYKKINQTETTKMVNGVKSVITVRDRVKEIREYLKKLEEKQKIEVKVLA